MSSLREAEEIWQAIETADRAGRRTALLTLVRVRGSAYRRPGTKMMMADDGRMVGTLSGGCLEGDLYAWAERAMASGTPALRRYDLSEDEMWGLGIGCKGVIDVWIEPLAPRSAFWQAFGEAVRSGQPFAWGGQLPEGPRFLYRGGEWILSRPGAGVPGEAAARAREPGTWLGEDGWLVDVPAPAPHLVVAGAGHDARPLVRLAAATGFQVTVLDPRPLSNTEAYFPDARRLVAHPGTVPAEAVADAFWVVMNHHQKRDEEALRLALAARPRYVGILGPLGRTREMLEHVGRAGAEADPAVFAPVGLDLGAETPEEVAVSVTAELLAVLHRARGGHLKGRERIHA